VKKAADPENRFNKDTRCTLFETENGEEVPHFKTFYENLNETGRHYCMWTRVNPDIKRQYTICNALTPPIFVLLMKMARTDIEKGDECIPIDKDVLMNPKEQKGCWMSYKNYKSKTGVATAMNRTKPH